MKQTQTICIDIHGMCTSEAHKFILNKLNNCSSNISEIEIIHGYNNGQALQKLVRQQLKHPRIERKIIGLNNGSTTLIIHKKESGNKK